MRQIVRSPADSIFEENSHDIPEFEFCLEQWFNRLQRAYL